MRGVFKNGRFSKCGDYPNGYPQCMGRASAGGEDYREMGNWRCTCVNFSVDEMKFARDFSLTIDDHTDLPKEWRIVRGMRDSELDKMRNEARADAQDALACVRDEAARIVESRENRMLDRRRLAAMIRRLELPPIPV